MAVADPIATVDVGAALATVKPAAKDPLDTVDVHAALGLNHNPAADAFAAVHDADPDHVGKVLSIADKTGEHPAYVDQHLPQMQRLAQAPTREWFDVLQGSSPRSVAALADPITMALTKDDLESLPRMERLGREFVSGAHGLADAFKLGWTGLNIAGLRARQVLGAPADPMELFGGSDYYEKHPTAQRPSFLTDAEVEQKLSAAKAEQADLAAKVPPFDLAHPLRSMAYGTAKAVPMLAGLAGSMIAGGVLAGPPGAIGVADLYWGLQGTGTAYDAIKQTKTEAGDSLSDEHAKILALGAGAAYAGLNQFAVMPFVKWGLSRLGPLGRQALEKLLADTPDAVLKSATVGSALLNSTVAFLKSQAGAGATMAAFNAIDQAAIGSAKVLAGEHLRNIHPIQGVAESLGAGLQGAIEFVPLTALAAISGGVAGYSGFEAKVKENVAKISGDATTALQQAAEASKLRQLNPKRFAAAMQIVLPDEMQTARIPAEKAQDYLYQSGKVDGDAVLKELGAEQAYARSQETGQDLEIPTAKLLGTKHMAALAADVKYAPDALTPNEASAVAKAMPAAEARAKEAMQGEGALSQEALEGDTRRQTDIQYAKNEWLVRLNYAEKPADVSPRVWAAIKERYADIKSRLDVYQGKPAGQTMEEFYREHPIPTVLGQDQLLPTAADRADFEAEQGAEEELRARAATGGVTPVMDAIRAAGGMNWEKAGKQGWQGELKDMNWTGIFRKEGVSPSKMAETLAADSKLRHLFPDGADEQAMFDRLSQESRDIGDFKAKYGADNYQRVRRRLNQEPTPEQPKGVLGKAVDAVKGLFPGLKKITPEEIAARQKANEKFDAQFSAAASDVLSGREAPTKIIPLGHTSGVLEGLGAKNIPMVISAEAIVKAREKHGFSVTDIQRLPVELRDPIMVFKSDQKPNSMVMLTDLHSGRKTEGIAAVHFERNEGRILINRVASLGARDTENVKGWLEGGKLLYADRERAAEWLRHAGIDGSSGGSATPSINSVPSKEDFVKAFGPLFQGGEKEPRAYYDPESNVIRLMRKADASSLFHEGAHQWLRSEFLYLRSGKASDEYTAERWKPIAAWLGVDDKQALLTRDQEEKFARGFESYLREGKAPTTALARAFATVKRWMLNIYRDASTLKADLNPEVRKAFDRMLASEEEVKAAEHMAGYGEEDLKGMDPETASWIRAAQESDHDEAVGKLDRAQQAEITPERMNFLRDEHDKATARITEEVKNSREYQAMDDLRFRFPEREGKLKNLATDYLAEKLDERGKTDFEDVAEEHGFGSGQDLAQAVADAPALEDKVSDLVNDHMSQYAELKDSPRIKEAAAEAVHSEGRLESLADRNAHMQELESAGGLLSAAKAVSAEATARRRAEARALAQAARERAKAMLEQEDYVKAGNFLPYVTAERNAAVKAAEARKRGDFAAAERYDTRRLLNHALAMEALKNKASVDKVMRYLGRYANRGQDFKNMPYGFIRQIDALLEAAGLRGPKVEDAATLSKMAEDLAGRKTDPAEIANATGMVQGPDGRWAKESLGGLVERVNEDYRAMEVPASVLGKDIKPYPHLSLADLRDINNAVRAIAEVGREHDHFISFDSKIGIREAAYNIAASIGDKIGQPYAGKLAAGHEHASVWRDRIEAIKNLPDKVVPHLINIRTVCHFLDRGPEGPIHDYILHPLERALYDRQERRVKMMAEMSDILNKFYKPEELAKYKTERSYHYFGRSWTREEILAMRLNWGAQSNRDRIMKGFRLRADQVVDMMGVLDMRDHDFCQAVHDHLETYWPQIKELEQKVLGAEPGKVAATPIETPFGTYRGGYYPLSYDFEKSADAYRNAEQRNALYKKYSAAAAHTDHGHTIMRVDNLNRPVRLSLDVLVNHLDNVVHDLAFRKAVIDVQRVLRQTDVRDAIVGAMDVQGYATFDKWLKAVASDQSETLGTGDRLFRGFRFGATFATLGYRATTFPLRLAGDVVNTCWELGPTGVLRALKDFYFDPSATQDLVDGKSALMRTRSETRDRDLNDVYQRAAGQGGEWKKHAFIVDTAADRIMTYPLWQEVYKSHLDKGEEKAVALADDAIIRTFGSGTILEQAGMQRGSELQKMMSMYGSYTNMMLNRTWLDGKLAGLEYKEGNAGKAAAIAGRAMLYTVILPAIYENLVREVFRNSQNDDEDARAKRILGRTLELPFSYIFVARDIGAAVVNQALGERGGEYHLSPMEESLNTILEAGGKTLNIAFTDKEYDARWAEQAARAAAVAMKYPQQVNTWVFNYLDWMKEDGSGTWRDFISRRTKH